MARIPNPRAAPATKEFTLRQIETYSADEVWHEWKNRLREIDDPVTRKDELNEKIDELNELIGDCEDEIDSKDEEE